MSSRLHAQARRGGRLLAHWRAGACSGLSCASAAPLLPAAGFTLLGAAVTALVWAGLTVISGTLRALDVAAVARDVQRAFLLAKLYARCAGVYVLCVHRRMRRRLAGWALDVLAAGVARRHQPWDPGGDICALIGSVCMTVCMGIFASRKQMRESYAAFRRAPRPVGPGVVCALSACRAWQVRGGHVHSVLPLGTVMRSLVCLVAGMLLLALLLWGPELHRQGVLEKRTLPTTPSCARRKQPSPRVGRDWLLTGAAVGVIAASGVARHLPWRNTTWSVLIAAAVGAFWVCAGVGAWWHLQPEECAAPLRFYRLPLRAQAHRMIGCASALLARCTPIHRGTTRLLLRPGWLICWATWQALPPHCWHRLLWVWLTLPSHSPSRAVQLLHRSAGVARIHVRHRRWLATALRRGNHRTGKQRHWRVRHLLMRRHTRAAMLRQAPSSWQRAMQSLQTAGSHAATTVAAGADELCKALTGPTPTLWACPTVVECEDSEDVSAATGVSNLLPDGAYIPPPGLHYTKDEQYGWLYGNSTELTQAQHQQLRDTVRSLSHCFAHTLTDLTGYTGPCGNFRIELEHPHPIYEKPRRLTPLEQLEASQAVKELLEAGFIEVCPTNGTYASNLVVAAKKDDNGEWTKIRTCIDFRKLNRATRRAEHGLHHTDDVFRALHGSAVFSKLDLRSGFYQLWIEEEDRNKTAFWCDRVMYRFKRMPFGLKCAPIIFQRAVDQCLAAGGCTDFAIGFIDDIIIYSQDPAEHANHVKRVLLALAAHGLKVHPQKSVFGADSVEYLGHVISKYGQSPHEGKVAAIKNMAPPTNVSEVRSVHGLFSYYRCYCEGFSAIAQPLTELTKKNARWEWGPAQQAAFDQLKAELCTEGKALRRFDPSKPVFLHTDWSHRGIGAVLGQMDETSLDAQGRPREYMVACISRSLNPAERNYSASKGEMLAAVWAMKMFRSYLHGVHFTLVTDHAALRWLLQTSDHTGQFARWALIVQDYDFEVVHRAGLKHQNADCLSRQPLPSSYDPSGAQLDGEAAAVTAHGVAIDIAEAFQGPGVGAHHALALMAPTTHDWCCGDPAYVQDWVLAAALTSALGDASFIDRFAPREFNLFRGHSTALLDFGERELSNEDPEAAEARQQLQRRAAGWVKHAMTAEQGPPVGGAPQNQMQLGMGPSDQHGVGPTVALDTSLVAHQFYAAADEGIVLYEPFGGLCAGLEMVLANGICVRRYLYSDTSHACQRVAAHRVAQLAARYPRQFTVEASRRMFQLPQDVKRITTQHLLDAGAADGEQWLVVAGWECQDLSAAGVGAGLEGRHSSTFWSLLHLLGALQQLQTRRPPAYLLENTFMQHDRGSVRQHDYPLICRLVGKPVAIDAAQCNSFAHRLRCFWTNLADTVAVSQVFQRAVRRTPGLYVDSILDTGRVTAPVQRAERCQWDGWYRCNVPGPRCVLPTLMATQCSFSFRDGRPGCIFKAPQSSTSPLELADPAEPNPDERERALGYAAGTTAAPGVTPAQRHRITGGCMDANVVKSLFAVCHALHRWTAPHVPVAACTVPAGRASAECPAQPGEPVPFTASLAQYAAAVVAAAATEAADAVDGTPAEVWEEPDLLQHLLHNQPPPGTGAQQYKRLRRRGRKFRWQAGALRRRLQDGSWRVVPPPEQRSHLVQRAHDQLGHLGAHRTEQLLRLTYWWRTLREDTRAHVASCEPCARAKAAFTHRPAELRPLPVVGLFYRWGIDLAGPFPDTPRGNKFAMIAIEHWSKTVVIVPIPNKEAVTTAYAFLHNVLARYGAPAVVVTDQGSEWEAEFQQLCTDTFVDLRSSSRSHPETNGLTERAVQTLKAALAKYCLVHEDATAWDVHCAWLALGYNCSPQASTRVAPLHILFGRPPTIPAAGREVMQAALELGGDWDGEAPPDAILADLLQRADVCRRLAPTVDENLAIAQHRDSQRYATVRSGAYTPRPKPLAVGDFVYLKRQSSLGLQTDSLPVILRVQRMDPNGVLTLMGKCGATLKAHVSHCARCSLPDIDPTINPALRPYDKRTACVKCGSPSRAAQMLLCDGCGAAWHNMCLPSPLPGIPPEDEVWVCPGCVHDGMTPEAAARQRASMGAEPRLPETLVFPGAQRRRHLERCQALDGRVVCKVFNDPATGRPAEFWGTVRYRGAVSAPHYFEVTYTDGDSETMALAALRRILRPAGTRLPVALASTPKVGPRRSRRMVAAATVPVEALDSAALLRAVMPGEWAASHLSAIQEAVVRRAADPSCSTRLGLAATTSLLAAVRLEACISVLDPFATVEGLTAALAAYPVVLLPAIAPAFCLGPAAWPTPLTGPVIEAVVMAPWPPVADLALALAVTRATRVVCCYVPLAYVRDAHSARRMYLGRLRDAGRLAFVQPRDPSLVDADVSAGVWLVISRTVAVASALLIESGPWGTVL